MDNGNELVRRNIIVMGASAGGLPVLKQVVKDLPADLPAAVFIVWHQSPDVSGILPKVLGAQGTLPVAHAADREPIQPGRIYVAPPDHHLLVEADIVRVTRGPRENRFRPAIDPLFRSAAFAHGERVIGVVLTGALDDGVAGLWTIKQRGGIAVVQDPRDAEVRGMPENALAVVKADHVVPAAEMGRLLAALTREPVAFQSSINMEEDEKTRREVRLAMGEDPLPNNVAAYGELSPFTCPECHGVLSMLQEGELRRFRCHTGHAFSVDSLLDSLSEKTEEGLWAAIRSIQETVVLLNHMGDHCAELNQPKLAAVYFKKALEAEQRAELVRMVVRGHEQLNAEWIRQQLPGAV